MGDDGAVPATYDHDNPFDFLTNQWAVHDTVLEIVASLSAPMPEGGYQQDDVRRFRVWFDFIGAIVNLSALEVIQTFQHLLPEVEADQVDPITITEALFVTGAERA